MTLGNGTLLDKGNHQFFLYPQFTGHHGSVADGVSTKKKSLQILTELFSKLGAPVFLLGIKRNLTGITQQSKPHTKNDELIEKTGITNYQTERLSVAFWDLFGNHVQHALRNFTAKDKKNTPCISTNVWRKSQIKPNKSKKYALRRQSMGEYFAKTMVRSVASRIRTQILRGPLDSLFKK